jgi:hypothetical protein
VRRRNAPVTGKEQVYSVDLEPLGAIRDGLLAGFATMQTQSLDALRIRAERAR